MPDDEAERWGSASCSGLREWRVALRTGRAQTIRLRRAPPLSPVRERGAERRAATTARGPPPVDVQATRLLFALAALWYPHIICVICGRLCRDLKFRA
jgi:hypothetical protein